MGLLEILATMDVVGATSALVKGGVAFHVRKNQGWSGNALKSYLKSHRVKVKHVMIITADGSSDIRIAVDKKDRDKVIRLLDSLGVSWWGG